MYRKIEIDGKELEFMANAATPFRFRQVFKRDLLSIFANEEKAQAEGVEVVTELAYVMNKQAEKADFDKVTFEDFLEWLEGFEPMAFIDASEAIVSVFTDSSQTMSTP